MTDKSRSDRERGQDLAGATSFADLRRRLRRRTVNIPRAFQLSFVTIWLGAVEERRGKRVMEMLEKAGGVVFY